MRLILLSFLITILFSLFPKVDLYAQDIVDTLPKDQKVDTLILDGTRKDTSFKSVLGLDTVLSKKHNPKVAIFRSAVLPGWGQAYNKKYWKIPIVYGALGTTVAVFLFNIKTYNELRQAVIYKSDTIPQNDLLIPPEFRNLRVQDLQLFRNAYRQYIDYSVLVFLLAWGLNVVDAAVDAHLKAFDVSRDLSLKVKPSFDYLTNTSGVSLVLTFKDKKERNLKPLP
ncbi:MAG: DUF5683 domain-containing protein [Ginsengibacter sp.]